MADFYQQMAAVSAELLAPTSQNGLGQGEIKLTRITQGTPDPDKPWVPVLPTKKTETLKGAVKGVDSKLVGTEAGSAVIRATDREVICAPPSIGYMAGDVLSIDSRDVLILSVIKIPAAGITSAVKFIVRS